MKNIFKKIKLSLATALVSSNTLYTILICSGMCAAIETLFFNPLKGFFLILLNIFFALMFIFDEIRKK